MMKVMTRLSHRHVQLEKYLCHHVELHKVRAKLTAALEMLNVDIAAFHAADVNCTPRSVVMTAGMPNLANQWVAKAEIQEATEISERGIASGHCVC